MTSCVFVWSAARGSRGWVRRYPGDGISLAVSPVAGAVLVTGLTSTAASFHDSATIAHHR